MSSEKATFGLQQRVYYDGVELLDKRGWMLIVTADTFHEAFFKGFYDAIINGDNPGKNFRFTSEHPDQMKTLVFEIGDHATVELVPFRTYPDIDDLLSRASGVTA